MIDHYDLGLQMYA